MINPIKFKMKALADLVPYAKNSRTHSDEQVAQIAASIQEFGFTNPVLIGDDNVLIAGHGRVMAARKLRMKEIPAMIISGLSETQRRALVLADNRLALSAGWDAEMLALEMRALAEDGYDMALTGFDEDEIAKFLVQGTEGETDPDAVPEVSAEEPVSKLGDIWILGRHRLACGSATDADAVTGLLAGVLPMLMVTDPPYGVNYDPTWRDDAGGEFGDGKTKMRGKVQNDDRCDWSEAWALFPGNIAYVWHSALHSSEVAKSLQDNDFKIRAQIIWVKPHFIMSRGDYHWKHEPCWYVVKGTGNWQGDRKQTTIWEIAGMNPAGRSQDKADVKSVHGTQKPVECMKRPIENNSSPGQAIYEPFSGSFTTGIACEMTGRICYAMEISEAYVDLGIIRWQNFTGKEAIHEATGKTFKEMQASGLNPSDVPQCAAPALSKSNLKSRRSKNRDHRDE